MTTRYLDRSEGKIAYDDTGSGSLVVCSPSMGDLRGEYRFLIPQLVAAGYRAVSLDVRGHGESSVNWSDYSVAGVGSDLLALVRALDAGPAVLIGDSMSGGAAVWAAAEAPELVSGLVLVDPFVRGDGTWLMAHLLQLMFMRPWGPAAWVRYYSSLYPTRKPDDFSAYTSVLKANLSQPGRLEALQKMLAASKKASEERISRVAAAAHVLMGSSDPDFKAPEAEARWVAEQLKGRYEMVPNAGHYPHAEMPDVTGPLILNYLKTLSLSGEGRRVA